MANMLTRIGFIDETSVKTNMAKTTGWAPRGERLIDHAPFGHWHTQTFIAALRHDRLDAPRVIDGPINRDLFDLCIETRLAPTLRPGDVIILDNLSSHKSPKAAAIALSLWREAPGFFHQLDHVVDELDRDPEPRCRRPMRVPLRHMVPPPPT